MYVHKKLNSHNSFTCNFPDEFQCHDGNCISSSLVCNGQFDCFDTSDELNCKARECFSKEYKCKMGKCISENWKCDGQVRLLFVTVPNIQNVFVFLHLGGLSRWIRRNRGSLQDNGLRQRAIQVLQRSLHIFFDKV